MKVTKYFSIFISLLALILSAVPLHSQEEMDSEVFLGVMSVTLNEQQLDELSYLLPWDISVTAYAYGDFSDDGRVDIVVALKELNVTREHSIDVYFFENVNDRSYKLVRKTSMRWVELPVEVAFLAKEGSCFVTNRDQSNWYFTAYKINNEELIQVSREVFPISAGKAGE